MALQKRFFDHFLKEIDNGWDEQPAVKLQVRHIDSFVERDETDWPLPRTQWTRFYLDPESMSLSQTQHAGGGATKFPAHGEGLTFLTAPLEAETEITGPVAVKCFISSSTNDADLFVVLRVFSTDGDEVVFQGAIDPHTPIAQGWLRASHRKLDPSLSEPWRPYHAHDQEEPLESGVPVELDIEVWPTSIVVPSGYRIGLSLRGKDYEYPHASGERLSNFKNELRGCGAFLHDDPLDRPVEIYGGETTLHTGKEQPAYVLLPIIPSK